ncbi:MAG TPA: hypothetical protein VE954_15650 [Oligoflexus sp.]|uniref:hypothetical protein n=1 Tax=Oligoflexus sp. TaxID=1971216 RepID=UPI002D23DDF9|nr:hypothetical protein [Oligoflexus sp.]HYX34536.1 hypothetical protein [Oligoflexus sp.]
MLTAFCTDFTWGNLKKAHQNLHQANRYLDSVGESFWRSLGLMAMAQVDYYGGETGDDKIASAELMELWKRVRFLPTPVGCTVRTYLHERRDEEVDFILGITKEAEEEIRTTGLSTLDRVFACLAPGEVHYLRGNYAEALPRLREATFMVFTKLHRIAYVLYAPVLYSSALVRTGQSRKAIVPLCFCWFNQLLCARIFYAQTLYATGEWLWSIGLRSSGRRMLEAGIHWAHKRRWLSVVAEGRYTLGLLYHEERPEEAEVYLQLAKDYYLTRKWVFFVERCEKLLAICHLKTKADSPGQNALSVSRNQHTGQAAKLRQRIETNAMLEIFLRLSSLGERDRLLEALLDSLCVCTGSEFGFVLLNEAGEWKPTHGRHVNPADI